MEVISPTKENLFFTPVSIDKVTKEMVEVSVFAKSFFNKELGEHPYFIEQECYAECEGDFGVHAFNPKFIGHSPSPQMLRYDGSGQDKLGTTFILENSIKNGSLTWNIPMYIFDIGFYGNGEVRKDKVLLDEEIPKTRNPIYSEYPEVNFEKMEVEYKLIAKIEVVQRFVLDDGFLTMSKNGADLLRLDLKQYPHIFQ
jgi:hypothetical protein